MAMRKFCCRGFFICVAVLLNLVCRRFFPNPTIEENRGIWLFAQAIPSRACLLPSSPLIPLHRRIHLAMARDA